MDRLRHYVELEEDELQKNIKRANRYEALHMRSKPSEVTVVINCQ